MTLRDQIIAAIRTCSDCSAPFETHVLVDPPHNFNPTVEFSADRILALLTPPCDPLGIREGIAQEIATLEATVASLRGALGMLAEKVGTGCPDDLGGHDRLCEGETIAPQIDTPCDCDIRRRVVSEALALASTKRERREAERKVIEAAMAFYRSGQRFESYKDADEFLDACQTLAALADPGACPCHSGSVCGPACAQGHHHAGCAADPGATKGEG